MPSPIAAPPSVPYFLPNPEDEQQQYSAAVRALAGTGAPPQQSAAAPVPQGAVPAVPMPQAPAAPEIDMNRYQQLEQAVTTAQQPVDRNANKPKWYDRLAGGLVGAGVGYNQGATAGINAGSAITNSRYTQAQADQEQRAKAAQSGLDSFGRGVDMQGKNYGMQSQGYENTLRGRRLGNEESNDAWDRDFKSGTATRDQKNKDRDYTRDTGNDAWWHDLQNKQFGETQTQHGVENRQGDRRLGFEGQRVGFEGERVGFEGERVGIDREKATRDRTQAKGDALKRGNDANKLDAARQTQLKALDGDDPKSGEPGYRSQRNSLMVNKKLSPEEKKAQVAQLDSEHADAKNQIEQAYSQGLQNLGYSAVPVTYGPDGKTVVNNSDGNAPGAPRQQAAPAAPPNPGRAPTPAGMVRMRLPPPDGREMFFPKANQAAAEKRGAQVIGE